METGRRRGLAHRQLRPAARSHVLGRRQPELVERAAAQGRQSLYRLGDRRAPKTGEIAWHYQFNPNDPFDYDGTNEMVLADLKIDGKVRKVIMHADRNGFFYVLDRTNG